MSRYFKSEQRVFQDANILVSYARMDVRVCRIRSSNLGPSSNRRLSMDCTVFVPDLKK